MNQERAKVVGGALLIIGVLLYLQGQSLGTTDPMSVGIGQAITLKRQSLQYANYGLIAGGLGILVLLAGYLTGGNNSQVIAPPPQPVTASDPDSPLEPTIPSYTVVDGNCTLTVYGNRVLVTTTGGFGKNGKQEILPAQTISAGRSKDYRSNCLSLHRVRHRVTIFLVRKESMHVKPSSLS